MDRWHGEPVRYPDPLVQVLDPSFAKYRAFNASVERLYTGARWSEGPAWFGDARALLWSDIPNNRILRWDEETGTVSVFRKPSNNANGHTRDRRGRLIGCSHGGRCVTRTEYAGLSEDVDKPLFNRALRGTYPSGSTIKPVLALAGLTYRVLDPDRQEFCAGVYYLPRSSLVFREGKFGRHGNLDLPHAIARSCDVYFYRLANTLGIDRIAAFASNVVESGIPGNEPVVNLSASRSRCSSIPPSTGPESS